MVSTTTEFYNLPQYQSCDHPDFLDDINKAYKTIDTELHVLSLTAKGNQQQLEVAIANIEALSTQLNLLTNRVAELEKKGE